MIILGTGITGSGRASYLKSVVDRARENGVETEFIDVGPMMFKKAENLGVEIPGDKILDLDEMALRFLRATVFESILTTANSYRGVEGNGDLYISLHMSFRWKKVLMHAFDYHYLAEVKPDVFVTVIDSLGCIVKRIKDTHWEGRLSLRELLIWQDEEIFITRMVADILDKPFYVIPASIVDPLGQLNCSQEPSLLYDIIYSIEKPRLEGREADKWRAYLSYPMTHVEDKESFYQQKNEFLDLLRRNGIVVFDPIMVEDHVLLDTAKESNKEYVRVDMFDIELPRSEILEARDYIIDSTVKRDYLFIDQSDMVIVFYPTEKLSAGVLSEMIYGFTHSKRVYMYFTAENISPFLKNYSDFVTDDMDKLVERIREDFEARRRR